MFRDHRVVFRREEFIAAQALRLRELANVLNDVKLDVVALVYKLRDVDIPRKGKLELKTYSVRPKGNRAYVSFSPLTLHVERKLLEFARWKSDPECRFIIAHEIGHVVLHDNMAKPYSDEELKINRFGFEEVSAEWQANIFAEHLLLPDEIASNFKNIESILETCCVPLELARKRFLSKKSPFLYRSEFSGDPCVECQNFTLVRKGFISECQTCGASTASIP